MSVLFCTSYSSPYILLLLLCWGLLLWVERFFPTAILTQANNTQLLIHPQSYVFTVAPRGLHHNWVLQYPGFVTACHLNWNRPPFPILWGDFSPTLTDSASVPTKHGHQDAGLTVTEVFCHRYRLGYLSAHLHASTGEGSYFQV